MVSLTGLNTYPGHRPATVMRTREVDVPLNRSDAPANPLLTTPSRHLHDAGKPSVVPIPLTDVVGAEATADVATLLRHTLVRELIRENEGMLMELAGLRETQSSWCTMQLRLVALEESATRGTLTATESMARAMCATRAHASLAAHVQHLEQQLSDEAEKTEELRGFAELAQAQLATSPRPHTHGATPEKKNYTSPPTKVQQGGYTTDIEDDSRRTSLEEITNVCRSVKRLRSVDSHDGGGSPIDRSRRRSSGQRSPGALTKMRKTIH
ncbi:hypothetical protein JKF63_06910 [Porcisia hertigi]|uniref:Uncharacterized protein n=1 Tax=Porcisia hertigi TaxID=2761500 RepID=A0A836LJC5_9TRYP|nr:hypothetical protein JKF63_06910 [Porcisia hertigi]